MEELAKIISQLGFPIAVAVFTLWNSHKNEEYLQNILETTLKENTNAIDRLSDLIERSLLFIKGGGENENE